ncbi:MAG: hypothetical protein QM831_27135 [Kofleriaceae bacterium]
MFAYDKKGTVFAMREGAELLVHDGPSEGPLWRQMLDADIVGLGANDKLVGAVTESGMVSWYGARTGDVDFTAHFDVKVQRALVDANAQRVIAVTADKILALAGNDVTTLADHTAQAIAQKPDGTVLAAVNNELVTLANGTRTSTTFPHPDIRALAWSPAGFWVVALAGKLYRWDGTTATHITNMPKDTEVRAVAAHEKAIAIMYNRGSVVALAWPSRDTLGTVRYLERKAEGIDFGPWPWLGIAMDLGDGNKQNLDEPERLHRSDTHPGREHHSWYVNVGGASKPDPKPAAPAAPAPAVTATRPQPTSSVRFILPAMIALAVVLYALLH